MRGFQGRKPTTRGGQNEKLIGIECDKLQLPAEGAIQGNANGSSPRRKPIAAAFAQYLNLAAPGMAPGAGSPKEAASFGCVTDS